MTFADLDIGDYFNMVRYGAGNSLQVKNGLNCAINIHLIETDKTHQFIYGGNDPVTKLDIDKVSVRLKKKCFSTTEGLDCYEADDQVVMTGEAFHKVIGL